MATMPKTSPNVVTINVFADGHAVPDKVTLIRDNGDQAKFCSDSDVNVVFDFEEGSPFQQRTLPVQANKCTPSGLIRAGAAKRSYGYHVNPARGAGSGADPTIIVN